MLPVYKYIQQNGIILLIHVNGTKYLDEFERVLQAYPKMKVICPHFCLLSGKLEKLADLMDKYPNLYTDTSFGYIKYTISGFEKMAEDKEKFQNFIEKYKERVFMGDDQVVTDVKIKKHQDFIENVLAAYIDILKGKEAKLNIKWPIKNDEVFDGLDLSGNISNAVLTTSPKKLLDSVPAYSISK
jgi:hypothetical protein